MFWNYVIPDGSTTTSWKSYRDTPFWNYVIPDGSTTLTPDEFAAIMFWNYVIPDGSTTPINRDKYEEVVLELCHSRWFYY